MGAITNKIFELLESGNNIEEHRSTGIIISSNWFDAVIGEDDRRGVTRVANKAANDLRCGQESISQKKSALAINDIP